MADSYSSQFVAICRTQLGLLAASLGADISVVYLTQAAQGDRSPQLEPLVSYPENNGFSLGGAADRASSATPMAPQQLFQPLTYEGSILGLLMAVRSDRPWLQVERSQVEMIGNTISVACMLERERQWQAQALDEREQFQIRQHKMMHNVLHQLRNPLSAIYTFSKLLLKRIPLEDANRRIVDNILRESEHLKELLQQLDSSIDGPPLLTGQSMALLPPASLQLQPCNVAEILEPILANGSAVAQERQLGFIWDMAEDLPLVLASASALREVLGNLIDNALKYTLVGEVEVNLKASASQLAIVVRDSGLGIPASDLPQLFQRSYRGVQAQGEIPGTGLGLSIAKELVEQMGGSIAVASPSVRGTGSEFTVTLPIARSQEIAPTLQPVRTESMPASPEANTGDNNGANTNGSIVPPPPAASGPASGSLSETPATNSRPIILLP
jgi:signal transduction histidine kinase